MTKPFALHGCLQTLCRIFFCVSLIAVAVFSLEPVPPAVLVSKGDLTAHFVAYGTLGGLFGLGWPRRLTWGFVIVSAFGFCLELAQVPVPGRFFDWLDVGANTLGTLLGLTMALGVQRIRL